MKFSARLFLLYAPALYKAVSFSDLKQSSRLVFWADPWGVIKVYHLWHSMSLNLKHTVISAPTVKESNVTADFRNLSFWINSLIHVDVSFFFWLGRVGGRRRGGREWFFCSTIMDICEFSVNSMTFSIWFIAFMLTFWSLSELSSCKLILFLRELLLCTRERADVL